MSVKAIIEKYQIKHIVEKVGHNIHIGSPYCNDIIVINCQGVITKLYKNRIYDDGWHTNKDLKRYQEEMLADQDTGELKILVQLTEPTPPDPLPVYTYKDFRVIKTWCETYGWPNVTIAGELMYDNTHFKTYAEAYQALLTDTEMWYDFRIFRRNMSDAFIKIHRSFSYLSIAVFNYLYARSIQRIVSLFYGRHRAKSENLKS